MFVMPGLLVSRSGWPSGRRRPSVRLQPMEIQAAGKQIKDNEWHHRPPESTVRSCRPNSDPGITDLDPPPKTDSKKAIIRD